VFDGYYSILLVPKHIGMTSIKKGIRPTPSLPGALAARFKVMPHLGIL